MTYLVILAFVAILGSLGAALIFMLRGGREGQDQGKRMARALAMRVGFSICVLAMPAAAAALAAPSMISRRRMLKFLTGVEEAIETMPATVRAGRPGP